MSIKKLLGLDEPIYRLGYHNKITYDELVNAEGELGRTLFGPIPEGHQREFFMRKTNAWVWYERYRDAAGVMQELVISYDVRPNGVYKKVGNGNFQKITGSELDNFRVAAKNYLQLVKSRLYC